MNKNLLVLLASLLLVVGVGAGCETTTTTSTNTTDNSAMEEYDDDDHMDDEHEGMTEEEEAMHMMEEEEASEDSAMMEVDAEMAEAMEGMTYTMSGELEDVTGGEGTGTAQATYENDEYSLYVTMENIPELEEGYFYEGWVVRHTPFDFISTGAAEQQEDGTWVNTYKSATDYSDYTNYVLTLEPDDDDPAPAEHILEGMMQ